MTTHRKWLLIAAAVLAVVAAVAMIAGPGPRPVERVAEAAYQAGVAGFKVTESEIDDLKSVFATVRSRDRIEARVRIPGTITDLKVDEGRQVKAGEILALVADQKIALRLGALDAQIAGARSRRETAKAELDRATELLERRVAPQSRVDQAKSAYDTAATALQAAEAERHVIERQIEEGQVLAPAAGRVLRVPVTVGSVMMAGESVATIAANAFLLRIELPERHARFLKVGDVVKVGTRGLAPDQVVMGTGRIVQVFPELQGGRVIADAEAQSLGDFFVGERARVWISAGKRRTIVIPSGLTFTRFGMDLVRVARPGGAPIEVVVQLGRTVDMADGKEGVEVLSGLRPGDEVVAP
jgi:RND family efflux transporter MFP subunit